MIDRLLLASRFLGRIFHRFAREDFGRTSASLAYTTLLSIVPLLAVILGAMSAMPSFLPMAGRLEQMIYGMLPERSAGMIVEYVFDFSRKALNVTIAGLLVLMATAFALLHTVEHAFNKVWRTTLRRSWWRRAGLYAALIALWPLALVYVAAAVSFAVSLSSGLALESSWLYGLLSRVTGVAVTTVFFAGLYAAVPNARVKLPDALSGAGFAAFGFLLMQKGFELYLSYFPAVTVVYGAFATVPIFLLWLYLSWATILLGALVAVTLPEFRDQVSGIRDQ